jgi:cell wall-associated NlpC family hydrolase
MRFGSRVPSLPRRKTVITLIAGSVLAAGLVTASQGNALPGIPARDINQVAAQVRDLQMKAAAAHERASEAKAKLASVQEDLQGVRDRQSREQEDLRITQGAIGDIARAVYATGGMDPALQVLLADDPEQFLAQAAVMDQLSRNQIDQLRQVRTNRLRLAQTEAEISDKENSAQQAKNDMVSAENDMNQQLDAAQQVLSQLQEEERQRLLELQRQHRLDQEAAARLAASQAAAAAASSSSGGASQAGGGVSVSGRAGAAIQYALAQVGDPYSYSANPPSSWDCSKLTAAAWAQAGVGLTPLSFSQYDQTRHIPLSEAQPGDLVFYFNNGAHHVGLYLGGGKMVHAANPSDGVEISDILGSWYGSHFTGIGRVIG